MDLLTRIFWLPVALLYPISWVLAGAWLAAAGQWWPVGAGIGIAIFGYIPVMVLLHGLIIFRKSGVYLLKKGIVVGVYSLGLIETVYFYGLITGWCGAITLWFVQESSSDSFWPLLIWAYGVATSPWTAITHEDHVAF